MVADAPVAGKMPMHPPALLPRTSNMQRHAPFLALLAILAAAMPAQAQRLAEDMTCAELISAFERSGVIYKRVHGKAMAMRAGVPVNRAQGLQCGPRNYTLTYGAAKTSDRRSCTYAVICYGKSNTGMLQHN
jgi:hypothetical protein